MAKIMQGMKCGQQYTYHSHTHNEYGGTANGQYFYQNSPSLAESTIARHNSVMQHAINNVETRIHQKIGRAHPFTAQEIISATIL